MGYVEMLLLRPVLGDVHPRYCEDAAHDKLATGGFADYGRPPNVPGCRVTSEGGIRGGREIVEELEVKEVNGRIEAGRCGLVGNTSRKVTL